MLEWASERRETLWGGSELDVVIGTDGGMINGVVRTSSIQPVFSAKIVWMSPASGTGIRVYQTTTSDSEGVFSFTGIAPGEYRMLALQDVHLDAIFQIRFEGAKA